MSFENFKYWGETLVSVIACIAAAALVLALVLAVVAAGIAIINLINMGLLFAMMWLIPPFNVAIAAYPVVTTFIPQITLLPIQIYEALSFKNSALTAAILIIVPLVINAIVFTAIVHFGAPAFIPHWFALSATHITFACTPLTAQIIVSYPLLLPLKKNQFQESQMDYGMPTAGSVKPPTLKQKEYMQM